MTAALFGRAGWVIELSYEMRGNAVALRIGDEKGTMHDGAS